MNIYFFGLQNLADIMPIDKLFRTCKQRYYRDVKNDFDRFLAPKCNFIMQEVVGSREYSIINRSTPKSRN